MLGKELDSLVANEMPRFGARSAPRDGWGRLGIERLKDERDDFNSPSWEEFSSALKKFKKTKSVKNGDVPGYAIAQGSDWLKKYCYDALLFIWQHPDRVPKRWWSDQIRFIPKDGRDTSELGGWRPIAVGGFFYGLVMRVWRTKLQSVAEREKWLSEDQFGFRPNRSSRGVVHSLRAYVEQIGPRFAIVRGDIERAFPSISPLDVSHLLISLGVPPSFVRIFQEVYSGAESVGTVNGRVGGRSGKCRWPIKGLRQGCPASPLLMALWTNEALLQIRSRGFLITAFADDVWIVCKPDCVAEAKHCLQTSFEAAGLIINSTKVQTWTPNEPSPFEVLGMPCLDGKTTKVSDAILNKTCAILRCGEDREYCFFKRVMFANTVVFPAVRYWVGGLSLSKHSALILSLDRSIRHYVRGRDWPPNTPIDFMCDKEVGLSLFSLSVECARDLISFVWRLARGGESFFLRSFFSSSWREALSGREHQCALLKDWGEVIQGLGGKTAIDWFREERNRPRHLRTTNVFPFGDRGSFLVDSLQKWPGGAPAPPHCANLACFHNPCGVLKTAREKGWDIFWVKEIRKSRKKSLFSYVREGPSQAFSKIMSFSSDALEKGCRRLARENQRKSLLFLSSSFPKNHSKPFLPSIASRSPPPFTTHEMKDSHQAWGLRVAQDRAQNPHNITAVEAPIPLDIAWGKEICANVECCTSACTHYIDAQKNGDIILWTDASFFPDDGKCAAAFGVEGPEGMKISAFRVRGSAARGELLAIFAALKVFSSSERNISVFSDCQSAIKKIENFISLAKKATTVIVPSLPSSSPLPPSLSAPPVPTPFPFPFCLSSTEHRISMVVSKIVGAGHSISLHWVKGHSGIVQNEMLDQAAKKEAQNRNRESLLEEIPEMMGELTIRDKIVESREDIVYTEWRSDLDKAVMKVAKSWMAKRVMAGIEQWRGLRPSWEPPSVQKKECRYCRKKHDLSFDYFVRKCPSCAAFRVVCKKFGRVFHGRRNCLKGE